MTADASLWGVVEIMGHRTRAGRLSDAQLGGATMLSIEHPSRADHTGAAPLRELYGPTAIFAIRLCSREEAEEVAGWAWPERMPTRQALSSGFDDMVDEGPDHEEECDCREGAGHDPDCHLYDPDEP